VHYMRSQIAVLDAGGAVRTNRNVFNGVLSVIGRLPTGTPVAFEAADGWGCLASSVRRRAFRQGWG